MHRSTHASSSVGCYSFRAFGGKKEVRERVAYVCGDTWSGNAVAVEIQQPPGPSFYVLRVSTRSIRLGIRAVVHGRYRRKRLFAREIVVSSGETRDDFSGRRALHDGVAYGC